MEGPSTRNKDASLKSIKYEGRNLGLMQLQPLSPNESLAAYVVEDKLDKELFCETIMIDEPLRTS